MQKLEFPKCNWYYYGTDTDTNLIENIIKVLNANWITRLITVCKQMITASLFSIFIQVYNDSSVSDQ